MNEPTHDRLFAGCGIASVVLTLVGAASPRGRKDPPPHDHEHPDPDRSRDRQACRHGRPGSVHTSRCSASAPFSPSPSGRVPSWAVGCSDKSAARPPPGTRRDRHVAQHHLGNLVPSGAWHEPPTRDDARDAERGRVRRHVVPERLLPAGCRRTCTRADRRALGWSAIGVATLTLIGTAVSLNNLGQMSGLLWFAWIVYASIAIARGKRAPARAASAVAQNA